MNINTLCLYCMHDKKTHNPICPHCGADSRKYTPHISDLPPLTILYNRYIVGRKLGSGGFGITYIALDTAINKIVSIKEFIIHPLAFRSSFVSKELLFSISNDSDKALYEDALFQFKNEIKLLTSIPPQKGIVQIYSYFYENHTYYYVMEYLEGITLSKYIEDYGPMSIEEFLQKIRIIFTSLHYLHVNGILHRNINPDNIMIDQFGNLTLFNFEVSKNNINRSDGALTLSSYYPPEHYATIESMDERSDIYALAATIYYCITGVKPANSLVRLQNPDVLKKPSDFCIKIKKKYENSLLTALSLHKDDRFESVVALDNSLRRFISIVGDSISTYTGFNPENYVVFYDQMNQDIHDLHSVYDTWWAKVNQYLHAYLCVNNSYSGCKVSGNTFPSLNCTQRTSALHNYHIPDIILIYAGFNDFGYNIPVLTDPGNIEMPSFYKDYVQMLTRIKANYPDSIIICGTLMKTYVHNDPDWAFPEFNIRNIFNDYNLAIRMAAHEAGVICADLASLDMRYETIDGTHPNKAGHETIAKAWITYLKSIGL